MDCIRKITIISLERPEKQDLNQEIQWFSNCFGMFNKRDKEKSCFRIFINLLKERDSLSSEQIARRSNLSRATVIHHLSKLINSGLVLEEGKKYFLRVNNLEELTREIEKDVSSTFKKLLEISREIDRDLEGDEIRDFLDKV